MRFQQHLGIRIEPAHRAFAITIRKQSIRTSLKAHTALTERVQRDRCDVSVPASLIVLQEAPASAHLPNYDAIHCPPHQTCGNN